MSGAPEPAAPALPAPPQQRDDPPSPAPRRRRDAAIAAAVALTLTVVYSANGEVLPGNDATGNAYLAANLLEEGRFSFSVSRDPWLFDWVFQQEAAPVRFFGWDDPVRGVPARKLYAEGRLVPVLPYFLTPSLRADPATAEPLYVNTFGPGAAIAALPVLAPLRLAVGDLRAHPEALWFGAKLAASLLVALSAAFVFLTARRFLAAPWAAALALAYGLGTAVWSTSSQTLWQHPASEAFMAAGIFFLVRARGSARDAALSGAALAAAVACRPTSAILAAAAAVYLLVVDRRAFAALALAAAPLAALLAAYNAHHLGSILRFGQTEASAMVAQFKTGSSDVWQTPLHIGIAGVLASPSRGLLVFSPWLAFAVPGAVLAWRRRELEVLRPVSIAALLVLAVEARWFDWWGGWSYGWRRVVDLAPLCALLAAPAVAWIAARRARVAAAGALVAWSVLVQAVGAFGYDVDGWNARTAYGVSGPGGEIVPASSRAEAVALARATGMSVEVRKLDIDRPEHRHRLWSIADSQIGYYLGNLSTASASKRLQSTRWSRERGPR
jgi:hypothetical protein